MGAEVEGRACWLSLIREGVDGRVVTGVID